MRAGFGHLLLKPNAKRANVVGSVTGLGPVAGSEDTGPGLLTDSEVGLGPSTGPGTGPDMGGYRILSSLWRRRCR
jgi:hypothetical protein